jgi:CDGSH-type Zn-finger protein
MSEPDSPVVALRQPCLLEDLPPGDYWWCACGRSKSQPFCDGSHQGTRFTPVKISVTRPRSTLWLCGCKHSRRPPHCDGFHNRLPK